MFGVGATMKRAAQAVEFSSLGLLTNLYAVTRKDSKIKDGRTSTRRGVKCRRLARQLHGALHEGLS